MTFGKNMDQYLYDQIVNVLLVMIDKNLAISFVPLLPVCFGLFLSTNLDQNIFGGKLLICFGQPVTNKSNLLWTNFNVFECLKPSDRVRTFDTCAILIN